MPANWSYVIAAYAIAAATLFGYWRHLARRARTAATPPAAKRRTA